MIFNHTISRKIAAYNFREFTVGSDVPTDFTIELEGHYSVLCTIFIC